MPDKFYDVYHELRERFAKELADEQDRKMMVTFAKDNPCSEFFASFSDIWFKVNDHYEADVETIKYFRNKGMLKHSDTFGCKETIPAPPPDDNSISYIGAHSFKYNGIVNGYHQWNYGKHLLKEKI